MIRRFNYTGRKPIPSENVHIRLNADRTIDVNWNFEEGFFPSSAFVIVEAFSGGSLSGERFRFGTVGTRIIPSVRQLTDALGESPFFKFKVVDSTEAVGQLLGIAEMIRPKREGDDDGAAQRSILPVNPTDLEDQVWRLTFLHGRPWLEVNSRIDGIMQLTRSDRRFFSLVYASVVREILTRILVIEQFTDPDGDPDDWHVQWLRWGIHWHPDNERPAEGERDKQLDTWIEWIEEVCSAFCKKHDVRRHFELVDSAEAK